MGHVSEPSTCHSDFNSARTPAGICRTVCLIFVPFAAGYFLSYFFRTINALISDALTAEFSLGARELGLLTSVYFLSAVIQLPLGVMVDRCGPRRVQSALLLVAAAGAAVFARGRGLWTLAPGCALLGIGAGSALISRFQGHRAVVSARALRARQRLFRDGGRVRRHRRNHAGSLGRLWRSLSADRLSNGVNSRHRAADRSTRVVRASGQGWPSSCRDSKPGRIAMTSETEITQ